MSSKRRRYMNTTEAFKRDIVSKPLKKSLPFSPAVGCGPLVFVSGLAGRNHTNGEIAKRDIRAQTLQAMRNVAQQLERAGTNLEGALKATIFLTDMRLYAEMNEAYVSFFEGTMPARTCVEVSSLPDPDALVEIELIACRP
jgi:2-iminobutanoate/2-iminopropanoate deaminase